MNPTNPDDGAPANETTAQPSAEILPDPLAPEPTTPDDTGPEPKTTKKKTKKKSAKKSTRKRTTKKKPAKADADAPDDDAETPADSQPDDHADDNSADEGGDDAQADTDDDASKPAKKKTKKKSSRKRTSKKKAASKSADAKSANTRADDDDDEPASGEEPDADMLINYVPGEECRIAIVEDGMLEEFYSEPTNQVSRVGNIYVGKVTNVESAIQAAFVDFGIEEAGFLHISDLHPQYFPGEDDDTTESVGKKVPRRERPPIQRCLKRGQEIIVQVLKEGVGTKGPTLTSYLSVPGRFLVMMPQMDRVGVSRKEEDDDKRKEAKRILAQLELPDNFGFILRTAGFGRTKAELKRDLAYLQRLWKDMEKRRKAGGKPRPLYTESDLLVRSLRDLLGNRVKRVIVDDEAALQRSARFMKIVAPRSRAELTAYKGNTPIFHAFDVERQIREIHAREVPLPSGGRLVIDQTEALVAIDVNSGRSKKASDAETNAYQTNLEAVDAICRQLRLRDLGGLVINDLIDMRAHKRRKEIENRFRERLKRDRAKSTVLPISEFGILEMTRQRMRGSQESLHFGECPTCRGRGLLQKPDSVAADALRELAALIDHGNIARAELVVNPRVAGALLSTRRQSLTRVELTSGKKIDVRVSDTLPVDRVTFYAYDQNGSDVDLNRLARQRKNKPKLEPYDFGEDREVWAVDPAIEAEEIAAARLAEQLQRAADAAAQRADAIMDLTGDAGPEDTDDKDDSDDDTGSGRKKRRRRRRGRRRRSEDTDETTGQDNKPDQAESDNQRNENRTDQTGPDDAQPGDAQPGEPQRDSAEGDDDSDGDDKPKRKRRRRRGGRRRRKDSDGDNADTSGSDSGTDDAPRGDKPDAKREPRAQSRSQPKPESKPQASESEPKPAAKKKRRGLYSAGRRKLSASETRSIGDD